METLALISELRKRPKLDELHSIWHQQENNKNKTPEKALTKSFVENKPNCIFIIEDVCWQLKAP